MKRNTFNISSQTLPSDNTLTVVLSNKFQPNTNHRPVVKLGEMNLIVFEREDKEVRDVTAY
jgi:hypothetical protein